MMPDFFRLPVGGNASPARMAAARLSRRRGDIRGDKSGSIALVRNRCFG